MLPFLSYLFVDIFLHRDKKDKKENLELSLPRRPIHHKSDDKITAHIFIVMLAYYLQWHFMQRVAPLFANNGGGDERRWSFDIIIKRLKSITKVEQLIKNIVIKTNISKPDMEQNEILRLLKIKL